MRLLGSVAPCLCLLTVVACGPRPAPVDPIDSGSGEPVDSGSEVPDSGHHHHEMDSGTEDAGELPDAGPMTQDAGSCPAGRHPGSDGGCDATLVWSNAGTFPSLREHHGTFITSTDAGARLWVVAGADLTNLYAFTIPMGASILPDGGLDAWGQQSSARLPKPLFGPTLAQVGGLTMVIGGTDLQTHLESSSTFITRPTDANLLTPWQNGPELGRGLMHQCAVADGEYVYVTGGLYWDQQVGINVTNVARTRANGDGGFEAWADDTAFPDVRSHHGCVLHDGVIYVSGGIKGNPAGAHTVYGDVIASAIQADHTLGPWQVVAQLPHANSVHSVVVNEGAMYVLGGLDGNDQHLAEVSRARIGAPSPWGPWEPQPAMPAMRAHVHQVPRWNGLFYSVGGAGHGGTLNNVMVGHFE